MTTDKKKGQHGAWNRPLIGDAGTHGPATLFPQVPFEKFKLTNYLQIVK